MATLDSNSVSGITSAHYCSTSIRCCALGAFVEGGYLIAKEGGSALIIAPCTTEVRRTWPCRTDAVITACAAAACNDWFIPTLNDMRCASDQAELGYWTETVPAINFWTDLRYMAPPSSAPCACVVYIGPPTNGRKIGRHFGTQCFYAHPGARAFRRVFY
jgi:hypothetical protein